MFPHFYCMLTTCIAAIMSCEGGKEKKSRNFACSLFVWDVWEDKAPRISISIVSRILSSDTVTHLDVVVHLAVHQPLPILMFVTLLTVDGKCESKDGSFSFVNNWYPYCVIAQILHEADLRRLEARLSWC